MTRALVVVDAQNDFSAAGRRPVPNHAEALAAIRRQVERARAARQPIAWVRHLNKPHEWPAFEPGTWGAELSAGLGPQEGFGPEQLFEKDVFGAFTGSDIEPWLRGLGVDALLLVGFFAHMCVSTTAREALMRDFAVEIDADATGSVELAHPQLGRLSADEVRRTALLHLSHLGATISAGAREAVGA